MPRRRRFGRRQTFHMRRIVLKELFTVLGTAVNKAYQFTLGELPGQDEPSALFDQYRINKVVVVVRPQRNTYNSDVTSAQLPQIVDLVDYDDATVLTTTNDYLQFATARVHSGALPFKRKFTPACAAAFVGSDASAFPIVGRGSKFKQWLDCSNATVPHYGYKLQIVPTVANTISISYEVWSYVYLSFRMVR